MGLTDLERDMGVVEFPRPSGAELERRYWAVPRMWPGATVAVIGGGPSLTADQVGLLARAVTLGRGLVVIAVNDAYRMAPWADLLFAGDLKWWRWHQAAVERTVAAWSLRATIDPLVPEAWGVQLLRNAGRGDQVSAAAHMARADSVYTHGCGGNMAVQIAAKAGAASVLLLGMDCRPGYWFGNHPIPTPDYVYEQFQLPGWAALVPALAGWGVEVINCTPGSALDCFPHGDLAAVMSRLSQTR